MKNLVIVLIIFFQCLTYAGSSNFTITSPCRTVDNVPVTDAAFSQCCNGGVPSQAPECTNGIHGVTLSALSNIQKAIEISNATLGVAAQLTGVAYDPSAAIADATTDVLEAGGKPAGYAMNSGSGPSVDGGGYKPNANEDLTESSDGSGGASGASGGAGGLGFGLSGGSGSKSGTVGAKGEALASKDGSGSGGYSSGDAGGGRGGSGGSSGSVTGEGAADLRNGNGKNSENANALNDEDGIGSATDPSDYFKRIDPSASIFKVVSARYVRKKSLWTPGSSGPQIVPVIKR